MDIVFLYRSGWSIKEISEETGIPRETVRRRLTKTKVQMRPQSGQRNLIREHQICELRKQGLFQKEIMLKLNISRSCVYRTLKRHAPQ